ncbi:MAG: FAD-dependent tricarballylate dehydrogenase TcuA, partial [bacterium]
WMERNGCRFQAPLQGTLQLSRTNAFFLGGGKALLNAYYHTAIGLGVKVAYDAEVCELTMGDGIFTSATVLTDGQPRRVRARSAVVASGGFQANLDWLREYWGSAADNFIVRGTPFAKGRMLRVLLDHGAMPVGDPTQCHAVAVDARAPKFDGGIVTRLDCIPFGIVVDKNGRRFSDEGEDFWPKRYAIWGRLVAQLPDQLAYSIFDSKATGRFMPSVFPAIEAGSLSELAVELSLDQRALQETVDRFNASVQQGVFDPDVLDDCSTRGLDPPKSHWALPLDTPPFYGYPLRPGITFTYLGVTVNDRAQVVMDGGRPVPNVFAAGEIMAGNVLGQGYLAGLGMTIGTVFGRIAGEAAARYALTH